jgi:hypothetical protein
MAVAPLELQASQTHAWVTRLALAVSGHDKPFTRSDLFSQAQHLRLRPLSLGGSVDQFAGAKP